MTAVIDFASRAKQQKTREVFAGSAEVIIFTGVRFERLHEDLSGVSIRPTKLRLPSRQNQATAEELE